MNMIYTLECNRCKHVTQVAGGANDANAKGNAGACPNCAAQGISWRTWHIRGKS